MERKIALVTGATSGIGEACARKFAEGGYDLILTGRNEEKLNAVVRQARQLGADVLPLRFDVRDRKAAQTAVASLTGKWAVVDVLINNAGLALGLDKEYEGDMDDWEAMIDTNIKGLLTMTRLIVPGMVKRNSGHVINIGSVAGDAAYAGGNVYCATKSAVKAITDGLRIDVAHTAVRPSQRSGSAHFFHRPSTMRETASANLSAFSPTSSFEPTLTVSMCSV